MTPYATYLSVALKAEMISMRGCKQWAASFIEKYEEIPQWAYDLVYVQRGEDVFDLLAKPVSDEKATLKKSTDLQDAVVGYELMKYLNGETSVQQLAYNSQANLPYGEYEWGTMEFFIALLEEDKDIEKDILDLLMPYKDIAFAQMTILKCIEPSCFTLNS